MSNRRLVIAGTGSGVGKTTLSIGIMAAMKQKGWVVQGFKCGPDYIDPTYHTAVTGRISRNLDSWMLKPEMVRDIVQKGSDGADIAIIEGVMGFFDGKSPTGNEGSTAHISVITESPVVLVVDCSSMARSAAAIVKGFQLFWGDVHIAAVIANQVGSEGHFQLVKAAIEQECGIPVVGFLKKNCDLNIPERHLGLVPSIERGELDGFFHRLQEEVTATVDIEQLYRLAEAPVIEKQGVLSAEPVEPIVRIAVAKDAAFHFYYEENFELLSAAGAELLFFSPLKGETVPEEADGLYMGGGFPEEFAEELAQQVEVKKSIQHAVERGMPTLAECGGFMFLAETLQTTDGACYNMTGVIPGAVHMQTKLAALGYRDISGERGNFLLPEGTAARGHEYHYSVFNSARSVQPAYETAGMGGVKKEGYMKGNLVAGYTHFHFGSCPELAENWVARCKEWRRND